MIQFFLNGVVVRLRLVTGSIQPHLTVSPTRSATSRGLDDQASPGSPTDRFSLTESSRGTIDVHAQSPIRRFSEQEIDAIVLQWGHSLQPREAHVIGVRNQQGEAFFGSKIERLVERPLALADAAFARRVSWLCFFLAILMLPWLMATLDVHPHGGNFAELGFLDRLTITVSSLPAMCFGWIPTAPGLTYVQLLRPIPVALVFWLCVAALSLALWLLLSPLASALRARARSRVRRQILGAVTLAMLNLAPPMTSVRRVQQDDSPSLHSSSPRSLR